MFKLGAQKESISVPNSDRRYSTTVVTTCNGRQDFEVTKVATLSILIASFVALSASKFQSIIQIAFSLSESRSSTITAIALPFFLIIASAILICTIRRNNSKWTIWIYSVSAITCILISATKTDSRGDFLDRWYGYGTRATLFMLTMVAILTFQNFFPTCVTHLLRKLSTFVLSIFLIYCLPSFIQPTYGLLNIGDTTYHVLDELLAPINGHIPYSDYSPQYSGVLGWLAYPVLKLPMSDDSRLVTLIALCNLLIALQPLLVVLIAKGAFPRIPSIQVLSGFVAVTCASGTYNASSIENSEFASFARSLPSLFIIWLTILVISEEKRSRLPLVAIALGVCTAFCALMSADFGLCLAITCILTTLIVHLKGGLPIRVVYTQLFVACLCILGYFLSLEMFSSGFSLKSYLGLRLAGNVYPSFPMSATGPHVIFLASVIAVIACCLRLALKQLQIKAQFIEFAFGTMSSIWFLVSFSKWVLLPRPQSLPHVFMPFYLMLLFLFGLYNNEGRTPRSKIQLQAIPLILIFAIVFAAATQVPNATDEYKRILTNHAGTTNWSSSPGRPSDGYSKDYLEIYDELPRVVDSLFKALSSNGDSVGYFGPWGNTVETVTPMENLTGIPSTESLRFGKTQESLACIPIANKRPVYVVTYSTSFPCNGYERIAGSIDDKYKIYTLLKIDLTVTHHFQIMDFK